ncbi:MAG: 4-alpha-glucanotransferase [bacterium]|nr:4-alpha-glucanotransferase [bacterium]
MPAMQVRSAGVLLHPTALPGGYGIGDLGPTARAFLGWLESAGQTVWQILPLGPPGHGDAPYGAMSAFAGNPLLISPEDLVADGLLPAAMLEDLAGSGPADDVDFGAVLDQKESMLRESWRHVRESGGHALLEELAAFAADESRRFWLEDWILYAALKTRFDQVSWMEWPTELRLREPGALEAVREELAAEIDYQAWTQFLFHRQWRRLRAAAAEKRIKIFGDVPIYVIGDSADVWAHQQLFTLDEQGHPSEVSGVPPDAFSEDGQLWGHPLYRWERMRDDGFAWWLARMRAAFEQVDVVRLDHFRGFAGYWSVPASADTAREGEWLPGPGADLFEAFAAGLGEVEIVAEDLGVITPDVIDLLRRFDLPGIKVLQFGFGEFDSSHLPHRHNRRTVAYTGTHDNDTTRGWYEGLDAESRERVHDYLGSDGSDPAWDLIRAAHESVAGMAIAPIQDVLDLGSEARFNTPGVAEGNWAWRLRDLPGEGEAARLRRLTELSGRLGAESADEECCR